MHQLIQPAVNPALKWLDGLLHAEIARLRARYELSLDELRGLYVSDEQVDALIAERHASGDAEVSLVRIGAEGDRLKGPAWQALKRCARWQRVVRSLKLDAAEQHLLLLTWAPHLNPAYETLYAYLNNDVTKRHVTADLAARVFRHLDARSLSARLGTPPGLFQPVPQDNGPPRTASVMLGGWQLAPCVARYLCGLGLWPPNVSGFMRTMDDQAAADDDDTDARIESFARLIRHGSAAQVIVISGAEGAGRRAAAQAMAAGAGVALADCDFDQLLKRETATSPVWRELALGLRVSDTLLYLRGFPAEPAQKLADALPVVEALVAHGARLMVPVEEDFPWSRHFTRLDAVGLEIRRPNPEARRALWRAAMDGLPAVSKDAIADVADQFELTPAQIESAARWISHRHHLTGRAGEGIPEEQVRRAARLQSLGQLDRLASHVDAGFTRNDLVLPGATMNRIDEIVSAIRHRHQVYHRWGLHQRIGGATGLVVLFSGTSGTGKTMAAGVIAREIGLDLYRIDLASVVSKYIGETEKNLDRIFTSSRHANCVLFFDEADALFGKRSEVKDAHDRYANIEIAYLLQKIEAHDGVVILATNIAKNIDSAFARRVHYSVDFPRPDAPLRERLWQRMFPDQAPLGDDVDYDFLARQFKLTGGEIRNVALDAAMLAARYETRIDMACLVNALSRHLLKSGRTPSPGEFKHYFSLLGRGPSAAAPRLAMLPEVAAGDGPREGNDCDPALLKKEVRNGH